MSEPRRNHFDSEGEMKFVCLRWPACSERPGQITLALDRDYTPEELARLEDDAPNTGTT